MLFTATNVPANTTDCIGNTVVENTRIMLTPNGPLAMAYGEIIDAFTAYPKSFLPATWTRLKVMCDALKQPVTMTDAQVSTVATACAEAVKDQFGPAFDTRVEVAARKAIDGRLDDDATT